MRTLDKIYIHCSYSEWGDVNVIRKWHLDKGWQDIGYHFVVYNQFTTYELFSKYARALANEEGKLSDRLFSANSDGLVVPGRNLEIAGAHVEFDNHTSIGICYVGITPTVAQYNAMVLLCVKLCKEHNISPDNVWGHYEYWTQKGEEPKKTCPNFNLVAFRDFVKALF